MRNGIILICLAIFSFQSCMEKPVVYNSYDEYPAAADADLWLQYSNESTQFNLWSPIAGKAVVRLYKSGDGGDSYKELNMNKENSLWSVKENGDLNGVYYTFQLKVNGNWLKETPGIYAKAVGVNGERAMVLDMSTTNPESWNEDKGPQLDKANEAILYELHVRDITTHPNAGSSFPGKFLGLCEANTKGPEQVATALGHMKELGITHVHLLPSFDNYSIDERNLDSAQFNWGYDPNNYNVPEGSYSSDPYRAEVRIREFKQMVKTFHDNGIGVILDVVYNHTGRSEESQFNQEVPGYYYRHTEDGTLSNASGCGNETASERPMMRKYMIESVLYWAKEYHLDGFRFDLMGIHDMETMNQISAALKKLDPRLFIYGEGWTAGSTPLSDDMIALKKNTWLMQGISAFSDDVRDGLKGSVFEEKSTGFVSGALDLEETVKFGIIGSIHHPQVDFPAVNYSDTIWANEPWQAVSYVSCHDNHTLFDKLNISRPDATEEELIKMHKLANAVVLTSQGIPFLHAGVEMMRSKGGQHNSYNLPDEVNQIDWYWKVQHKEVFEYYKSLIELRKAHPAFYMPNADMVRSNLMFHESRPGMVGFTLRNNANSDSWKDIVVWYNASNSNQDIVLKGGWTLAAFDSTIDLNGIRNVSGTVTVPAISMLVAYRK
jgi:pullulanase